MDIHERHDRGMALLMSWLSPEQLAMFKEHNYFEVRGSNSGRLYRIEFGTSHNVTEFDTDGKEFARLCFVPHGYPLVAGDILLHQKLVLEHDELSALAVAVRSYSDRAFAPRNLRAELNGQQFSPTTLMMALGHDHVAALAPRRGPEGGYAVIPGDERFVIIPPSS